MGRMNKPIEGSRSGRPVETPAGRPSERGPSMLGWT